MPETAKRVDPYITCYFGVEIDGIQEAANSLLRKAPRRYISAKR
jgi:hypothetical protein